jgi:hypothetical protein
MEAQTYRPEPRGVFVEVPYPLLSLWTSGGYTWEELERANGLPNAVVARLGSRALEWCVATVKLWPDVAAYRAQTQEPGCRVGRAWLEPWGDPTDRASPVRLVTGVMNAPMVVGPRRRWRW